MCAAKLKEALNDCLINFDRRVLLTDLINEYHMTIEEVSQTLTTHLEKQEKEGTKYEKRYVVHGIVADEAGKEVFTIVKGETKLNEWLNKLKDAESSLYSVEITGGAKAPAENLKPVEWCAIQLENLEKRVSGGKKNDGDTVKTNATATAKAEIKIENKPSAANVFTKSKQSENKNSTSNTKDKGKDAGASISKTVAVESSKTSPIKKAPQKSVDSKKVSPKDKKAAAAAKSGQKNIGSFFAPKGKDAADATGKAASGVIRQKTPKKLNDFFKKQVDAKETLKHEEKKANTSTQLFTDDGDDAEEEQKAEENVEEKTVEVLVESSDEEEEINKLRKKVLDADKEELTASKRKRLRIEDSDEEESEEDVQEQPQQKQSKLDEAATEIDDSPPKSETYLDEDGFVITVKSKKTQSKATSSTAAKARPKTPKNSSPKDNKSKQTPTPAAKTKQGNIMNFFKKK